MNLIKQLQLSIHELEAVTEKYQFALSHHFDEDLVRGLLGEVEASRGRLGALLEVIRSKASHTLDTQALPLLSSRASAAITAAARIVPVADDFATEREQVRSSRLGARKGQPVDDRGQPVERRTRLRRLADDGSTGI